MCIALLTTAHPAYKLILIDNRDEYINRPTASASWWPDPNSSVLGGRDLLRPIQGTWLGITKSGKIAVLTNFREDTAPAPTAVSRGEIIKKFLTEDVGSTEEFVREVVNEGVARDAGGFSLVCGRVKKGDVSVGRREQLAVISNRARSGEEVPWICGDVVQTVGLSNTHFGDRTWPKVLDGEVGLLDAVRENLVKYPKAFENVESNEVEGWVGAAAKQAEEALVKAFLELLSDDALSRKGLSAERGVEAHIFELRNSILVPPLGRKDPAEIKSQPKDTKDGGMDLKGDEVAAARTDEVAKVLGHSGTKNVVEDAKKQGLGVSGIYATQKQTVVLVDQHDRVRFVERTLFDESCEPVKEGQGIIDIQFKIQ
ncbi:hypothetical protein LTS08_001456 [Lithohypha guttulata]|nr:hypothetical protein LTS08_001456 [Lithohypha guttulata]